MDMEVWCAVLAEELGAKQEGDAWLLDESSRVTLIVRAGDGIQTIDRVRRVRVTPSYLAVTNGEGTSYLALDCIHSIRDGRKEQRNDQRPGFH